MIRRGHRSCRRRRGAGPRDAIESVARRACLARDVKVWVDSQSRVFSIFTRPRQHRVIKYVKGFVSCSIAPHEPLEGLSVRGKPGGTGWEALEFWYRRNASGTNGSAPSICSQTLSRIQMGGTCAGTACALCQAAHQLLRAQSALGGWSTRCCSFTRRIRAQGRRFDAR